MTPKNTCMFPNSSSVVFLTLPEGDLVFYIFRQRNSVPPDRLPTRTERHARHLDCCPALVSAGLCPVAVERIAVALPRSCILMSVVQADEWCAGNSMSSQRLTNARARCLLLLICCSPFATRSPTSCAPAPAAPEGRLQRARVPQHGRCRCCHRRAA